MVRHIVLVCLVCSLLLGLAEAEEPKYVFLDLQGKANQDLKDTLSERFADNHLGELPQGEQKLGGVPFKIGPRCLLLGSTQLMTRPVKIDIPVKRKFATLHMLHGTMFGAGGDEDSPMYVKDGALIGEYTVRYADGSTEGVFVIYGEDVRDWWNWNGERDEARQGRLDGRQSDFADVRRGIAAVRWPVGQPQAGHRSGIDRVQLEDGHSRWLVESSASEQGGQDFRALQEIGKSAENSGPVFAPFGDVLLGQECFIDLPRSSCLSLARRRQSRRRDRKCRNVARSCG